MYRRTSSSLSSPCSARRLSLAWLMWLALLLPAAQLAANWHGLSHARTEASRGDDGSPATTNCELCLSAAALDGGGLQAATPTLALAAVQQALPVRTPSAYRLPALVLAYRSRAPPAL